jgi:hypothetical protein
MTVHGKVRKNIFENPTGNAKADFDSLPGEAVKTPTGGYKQYPDGTNINLHTSAKTDEHYPTIGCQFPPGTADFKIRYTGDQS